ncbi:transposase [bacterium]|nr:transposase [bacterium]
MPRKPMPQELSGEISFKAQAAVMEVFYGQRRKVEALSVRATQLKAEVADLKARLNQIPRTLRDHPSTIRLARSYDGPRTTLFLGHLLRHLRGNVIVVWDRGSHHRAKVVRDLLAKHPRFTIDYLFPYAPELNPVEYLWSPLKELLSIVDAAAKRGG